MQIGQHSDHGFDEPLGLLSDCHRRIEHFLRVLSLVDEQAAGGPLTLQQRTALEGALKYFTVAAPKHTADEEDSLFPRLRASQEPAAADALATIARLERDHGEAGEHHRAVDSLVQRWLANDALEPDDARALREGLTALQAIYREHIGVEDREIFPAAARLLSASQIHDVGREMAARRAAPVTMEPARG